MKEVLRKVGGQTVWQLVGKLITSLTTLLLLSLISRYYGESGIGIYTLTITYLGLFYLAADLGVNAYGLRYIDKDARLFQKILGFRILLSVLLVLLSLLGSVIFIESEPLVFWAILFGSVSIFGSGVFTSTNLVFQSRFRYDLSVVATVLSSLVSLLIIASMLMIHMPLPYLLIGHTVGWISCLVLSLWFARRFVKLQPEYDLQFVKKMMINNWPISLTLLLNVVYFRIDTFIISFSKGIVDVGIYNLAYQFFSNALVFPTFMMNALYPLFLKTQERSKNALLPFLIKAALIMGSIGFMGTVITYILSPVVISLVAGEGFRDSVNVLRILSLSFPAFFLSAVFMWGLVTVNLNKQMLFVYLIGLVVNLVLNAIYTPQYSYIAASWVTVICEYIILLLQLFILIRYFKT